MTHKPKKAFSVSVARQPKTASNIDPNAYHAKRPVWRVGLMQMAEPDGCGWSLVNGDKLHDVRTKLAEFERLTWREILVQQRNRHHPIAIADISTSAKQSLVAAGFKDVDEVISLRLSGAERIFGVMDNEVFQILWWDPDHQVCPVTLRYT